jgi:hypothetical protein
VSRGVRRNALVKAHLCDTVRNASTYLESKETYPLYVKMRIDGFPISGPYFPEGRETADKIDRIFSDKPALRQAILRRCRIKVSQYLRTSGTFRPVDLSRVLSNRQNNLGKDHSGL